MASKKCSKCFQQRPNFLFNVYTRSACKHELCDECNREAYRVLNMQNKGLEYFKCPVCNFDIQIDQDLRNYFQQLIINPQHVYQTESERTSAEIQNPQDQIIQDQSKNSNNSKNDSEINCQNEESKQDQKDQSESNQKQTQSIQQQDINDFRRSTFDSFQQSKRCCCSQSQNSQEQKGSRYRVCSLF